MRCMMVASAPRLLLPMPNKNFLLPLFALALVAALVFGGYLLQTDTRTRVEETEETPIPASSAEDGADGAAATTEAPRLAPAPSEPRAAEAPRASVAQGTRPGVARLAGVLRVPADWELDEVRLVAETEGLERKTRLPVSPFAGDAGFRELPFALRDVPTGPVRLRAEPTGGTLDLTLPAEGREDVLLEAPEPVQVLVEITVDGDPTALPGGRLFVASHVLERDGFEPFRAQLPNAPLTFRFEHPEAIPTEELLDPPAGSATLRLEATRAPIVLLSFYDENGRPHLPLQSMGDAFLGPGQVQAQLPVEGFTHQRRIVLSAPGLYEVDLDASQFAGKLDPDPFEVEVAIGTSVEVPILMLDDR